ncbi:ATP:cob(I)alamin adenosyltransferase [Thermoflexus sp.]|uniref:ATP:cob(I)alamin adenosyltransferase n=1 Tax=Thermoflexus sp. TaxID=1969742 RepID=UPI0026006FA1|nr:ATP:cob(I)alamin adenosyltransferase [Thermoflexus sp.]MDW8181040.1 ATP:cob(I)alamin adenosyltransferase [Anaerolineae bacterium]MCS6964314.1 ATP:cob(I)alamin adenosyltransferase [Thermoflexus sp.]MCS7351582.1 ATP:cob(I)alamin adenosyltransferase [Thermoflexus sp.]MCX7689239.1 ATP:cob(I)alamin adenosyltransferase [Thermoflexus sp.]MDW8183775.1 ATP:cob(I)alamin adenosyltransferase [Anaerolineae bacterium]
MNPSLDTLLLELIAWLGFARACAHSARVQDVLLALQMDLQRMIGPSVIPQTGDFSSFVAGRTRWLEETREALECECLSRGFSELPGDTVSGAILDLLSIMTRRMSQDHQKQSQADSTVREYLERLPAMLFTLARYEEWQADPQR